MLVNVIYLTITLYYGYIFLKEPKLYKLSLAPLILVSYISNQRYLDNLDNRITITIYILVTISTGYFISKYLKEYKIKRVRERQRLRDNDFIE